MRDHLITTLSMTTNWSAKTGITTDADIHNVVKGWAGTGTTVDVVNPTQNPDMHQVSSPNSNNIRVWLRTDYYDAKGGYNWGAEPKNTTSQMAAAGTAYHQFPCSKCHTPHASSLPRLMVSNCLDVGTSSTQRQAKGA